ncbi:MAG: hypothetical protein R2883_01975 [Caldisericia bacterium]
MFESFGPNIGGQAILLEIAVGAILTQQVAWKNVEKAINNLKENDF